MRCTSLRCSKPIAPARSPSSLDDEAPVPLRLALRALDVVPHIVGDGGTQERLRLLVAEERDEPVDVVRLGAP